MGLKKKIFPEKVKNWNEFFDIASDSSTHKVNAKFNEGLLTPPRNYSTKFLASNEEGNFVYEDISNHMKLYQDIEKLKASKDVWTERSKLHNRGESTVEALSLLETIYGMLSIGNYNENADLNLSYKHVTDAFPFIYPFEVASHCYNRMNFDKEGMKNLGIALTDVPKDENGFPKEPTEKIVRDTYNSMRNIYNEINQGNR